MLSSFQLAFLGKGVKGEQLVIIIITRIVIDSQRDSIAGSEAFLVLLLFERLLFWSVSVRFGRYSDMVIDDGSDAAKILKFDVN